MKSMKTFVLCSVLALAAAPAFAAAESGYGASGAAASAPSWSLEQMLRYAVEDEYAARAEYVTVMRTFGAVRPFSNIKEAEDQHLSWLSELYAARRFQFPSDKAASLVPVPATLPQALKIGEKAEIDNIAMYESFLKSPVIAKAENADVKAVFERLKKASENHLRAFRNQLSK
jgi:hypothetical protein